MRFIIFVIDGPNNPASPDEMHHIDAFNEKLQSNGHWITAAGIQPCSSATLIDNRANKGDVTAGSLFDSPEFYSGFWIIEAETSEMAHELAMEGSLCCNRKVELRPYIR
ncbi:MAG: YciI family protein [Candidatus Planktophila sp.]